VTANGHAPGWRMWVASSVMMICSWLSYVDRQILAVLSPVILADTGLTAERYAEVVSAFSIAYMISNPLWGSILDYIGLRAGMLIAVAVWTVASASHAWLGGFIGFAAARAVLGLGEGATFPGGLRTAIESLPPDRQSRGIAISYSGGSLGAILTPLMVTPIAARYGWRFAFLLSGFLGLVWLAAWWSIARPPYLPANARKPHRIMWPDLRERRFWALVSSYALGAVSLGPILYLAPLYLNRVLGLTQSQLGTVLWVPPLGWEVGYFIWGWAADRYAPKAERPVRFFAILAVLSLPLAAVTTLTSTIAVLALFFWAMFIASGFVVLSLRTAARAYPQEQTALVAGIGAGSWSAIVALILPVLGRWFDQQLYATTFVILSVIPILGTAAWCLLTAPMNRDRKRADNPNRVPTFKH
jgi:MFS transporter, ACS family, hexuronate transporter